MATSRHVRCTAVVAACALLTLVNIAAFVDAPSALVSTPWSAGASMSVSRDGSISVLMANGKVLVAGGYNNTDGALASAEIYDPTANTWTAAASMSQTRLNASVALLASGKVLAVGGLACATCSSALSSAEVYDPTADSWSSAGSMAVGRQAAYAVRLPDGRVLIAGGGSASADFYNPTTNTWSATAAMNKSRQGETSTLLASGKVLVSGGDSPADAEVYDPAANTWTLTGAMGKVRAPVSYLGGICPCGHTATLLPNGKVLVTGGYNGTDGALKSTELYDPTTNSWSAGPDMTTARWTHTATRLPDGTVLVAGGHGDSGGVSTAEIYDPATNSWSSGGSMTTMRYFHYDVLLPNAKVLLLGGWVTDSSYSQTASTDLYTFPAPDAPTLTSVRSGNGWVNVGWTAPASNGSPITKYTVTLSTGETLDVPAGAIAATLKGITNGTARTAHVTATSAAGTGLPSAESAPVTPAAASVDVTTTYDDEGNTRLLKNATYFGQSAIDAQRTSVGIVAYIVGIVHASSLTPLADPGGTGAHSYTTPWSSATQSVLVSVMRQYCLTPEQAQQFSVRIVGFLLALGGH